LSVKFESVAPSIIIVEQIYLNYFYIKVIANLGDKKSK